MSWKSLFLKPTEDTGEATSEDIDIDALLASTRELTGGVETSEPATPPPVAPMSTPAVGSPGPTATLVKNRPLSEIYQEFHVPPSPKTVDELLAFLGGISNMPAPAQAQIITAMDQADDNWEIGDVISDAQAKIQALGLAKQGLDGQLQSALSASEARVQAADQAINNARSTIGDQISALQSQIAEMQNLLAEEEKAQMAIKTAAQQEQIESRSAAQSEAARYDSEVARLQKFITTFSQ